MAKHSDGQRELQRALVVYPLLRVFVIEAATIWQAVQQRETAKDTTRRTYPKV